MVPAPHAYFAYDYWVSSDQFSSEYVELTCFMPNGAVIPLMTMRNATLQDIKEVKQHCYKLYA